MDSSAGCRTASGTAVTDIGPREVDTTVTSYKICLANGVEECPSGTLTHFHKTTGKTVTVTFDGTDEATIEGPNGGTIEVPLVCGS